MPIFIQSKGSFWVHVMQTKLILEESVFPSHWGYQMKSTVCLFTTIAPWTGRAEVWGKVKERILAEQNQEGEKLIKSSSWPAVFTASWLLKARAELGCCSVLQNTPSPWFLKASFCLITSKQSICMLQLWGIMCLAPLWLSLIPWIITAL